MDHINDIVERNNGECHLHNDGMAFVTTSLNGGMTSILYLAEGDEYVEIQHDHTGKIIAHYEKGDEQSKTTRSHAYLDNKSMKPMTFDQIINQFHQEEIKFLKTVPEQYEIEGHKTEKEKEMIQEIFANNRISQIEQIKHIKTLKMLMDTYGINYKK